MALKSVNPQMNAIYNLLLLAVGGYTRLLPLCAQSIEHHQLQKYLPVLYHLEASCLTPHFHPKWCTMQQVAKFLVNIHWFRILPSPNCLAIQSWGEKFLLIQQYPSKRYWSMYLALRPSVFAPFYAWPKISFPCLKIYIWIYFWILLVTG